MRCFILGPELSDVQPKEGDSPWPKKGALKSKG
jgi:hypothetical protein